MKNGIRPTPTDPVKAARATLEEKRRVAASRTLVALGTPAVDALAPPNPPHTLDDLVVAEMTLLEASIGLLQHEYETIMRTITRKREQLNLLQQYRAVTQEDAR